jgi:hypothetical protein
MNTVDLVRASLPVPDQLLVDGGDDLEHVCRSAVNVALPRSWCWRWETEWRHGWFARMCSGGPTRDDAKARSTWGDLTMWLAVRAVLGGVQRRRAHTFVAEASSAG